MEHLVKHTFVFKVYMHEQLLTSTQAKISCLTLKKAAKSTVVLLGTAAKKADFRPKQEGRCEKEVRMCLQVFKFN